MFTGCGSCWGYCVMGIAYRATLCKGWGQNVGVNVIHMGSPWLTFAHELGHNFDGAHSFEEGQGSTGGIMDYGDGKIDGHYQFNTKYRKDAICALLDSKVNTCSGKFQ